MTADAATFAFDELQPVAPSAAGMGLKEAKTRAQAIIDAAEARAAAIAQEAQRAGYDAGYATGRTEALQQLQPAASALAEAVEAHRKLAAEMADRIEVTACDFALRVAERVIAGTIEVEPERVVEVIRGALRTMVERERIVIQVNPADLEIVRDALGDLLGSLGGIGQVEVQEERRVLRGGAILRTPEGEIDASIETKLERLAAAVAAELAS